MSRPILTVAQSPGVEFETFQLRVRRGPVSRYRLLLDLPNGAHVHFSDIDSAALRSSVYLLNRRQQKIHAGFYLSVHAVSDRDPKGRGFRVLRQDREIKP